jgi:hypothetical protein
VLKIFIKLFCSKCQRITDVGISALAHGCRQLEWINLDSCEGITDVGISGSRMLSAEPVNKKQTKEMFYKGGRHRRRSPSSGSRMWSAGQNRCPLDCVRLLLSERALLRIVS